MGKWQLSDSFRAHAHHDATQLIHNNNNDNDNDAQSSRARYLHLSLSLAADKCTRALYIPTVFRVTQNVTYRGYIADIETNE